MWRKEIWSTVMLSICFVLLLAPIAQANSQFNDVKASPSMEQDKVDAINLLVEKGIISGYTENGQKLFKPHNKVNRAQVAKMVVLATGQKPLKVEKSSFTDVPVTDTERSGYIERAHQLGYFPAKTGGSFKPNEDLTRGEMSYVLAHAFNLDLKEYEGMDTVFSDVNANHTYAKEVNAIFYNGIAVGPSGTRADFGAANTMTRAQFSLFIARAMDDRFRLDLPVKGETDIPDAKDVIAIVRSTTDGLNVRSTASSTTNNNIVGVVNKGGNLAVYDFLGDWVKISYKGKFAYVYKTYLEYIDPDTRESLGSKTKEVTANDALNLYYGASSSSKKISQLGIIAKGTKLPVYKTVGGYYQVIYKGVPGYVVANATTDVSAPNPDPDPKPNPGPTNTIGRVTVDFVNVRAQANNQSQLLGQLKYGQKVSVNKISGYWANVNYNGRSAWVYKSYLKLLNQNGKPLQNRVIVIDAGHGGKDPGALSFDKRYREKDITLAVANKVSAKLRAAGADVRQTRTTDKFLELWDITAFTDRNEAEIFVSIHVNSFASGSAHGTETYYSMSAGDMYREDIDLATFINNNIVNDLKTYDRKVKKMGFYVIHNTIIPAVLVELGFITNQNDLPKLINQQDAYADAIYKGIVQYYTKQ